MEGVGALKTIYKYMVPIYDTAQVKMPKGARVLHVGAQGDLLPVWAEVEVTNPIETRVFHVRGTGNPLLGYEGTYLGTAQVGRFVWHVYDAAPGAQA